MTQPIETHKDLSYPGVISQLVGVQPAPTAPAEPPSTSYGPSAAPQTRPEAPGGAIVATGGITTEPTGAGALPITSTRSTQAAGAARDLRSYAPDPRFQGLFQRFGEELGQTRGVLEAERGRFREAAGPSRSFQDLGGEEFLGGAIRGGRREDQERAEAQAFATYAGPRGLRDLPEPAYDRLVGDVAGLQERGRAGRTQAGTEELLREREQGELTPGELRFEARRLQRDPGYRAQAQSAEEEAGATAAAFEAAGREAEELAGARAAQEDEIRRLTQEYLKRERGGLEDIWGRLVEEERARQDQAAQEAREFQATGSLKELRDLQAFAPGVDLGGFETPTRQALERGEAVRAEILARPEYAAIRDVPALELSRDSHGRELLAIPDEWLEANAGRYSPQEFDRLYQLALERQSAFVNAGFSPRAEDYRRPEATINRAEPGEFGTLFPLYFGEEGDEFAPEDVRSFVHFDPGLSPSRENVSSAEQRAIFNRIQEILREQDRIDEPEEALRSAQVMADLGEYLEREKQGIEERRNRLDERQKEWAAMLRSARKKYKKTQEKSQKFARAMKAAGWPGAESQGALAGQILGGLE